MDKFASIRAFTQVVEAGSFAAAARKMQLSRSAVNKLVINLENQLKVQLLYRTTRQVTPTKTGRAFYQRCVDILEDLEAAELAVVQEHTEPKGTLKINAPMSFGISCLGVKIAKFMNRYADLKIQLTLEDRFVDAIAEGYDLVIRIGSPFQSPNLIVQPLAVIPRLICAAPSYLEAKGMPHLPHDLKNHSCLHYGYLATGSQWQLINKITTEEEQVKIDGVFCSNNGEVLRDAAVKGLGIVMLPKFIIEQELARGELQVILADYHPPKLHLCLIYPVNRHLSTKIQLFTQFLQESFSQD